MRPLFIFLLLVPLVVNAQEIIVQKIEIKKPLPGDDNPARMIIEVGVITDISNFSFKLDDPTTLLAGVSDDTGHDLLEEHEEYWSTIDWREPDPLLKVDDDFSSGGKEGFLLKISLEAAPVRGARLIRVKGTAGMINAGEKTSKHKIKKVPTEHEYGAPGMETKIGELFLSDQGKWFGKYYVLRVENQNPIVSVAVNGGDDREAFLEDNGSLEPGDLVFIEKPAKVDLEIMVKETVVKIVPLDLEIPVGF